MKDLIGYFLFSVFMCGVCLGTGFLVLRGMAIEQESTHNELCKYYGTEMNNYALRDGLEMPCQTERTKQ